MSLTKLKEHQIEETLKDFKCLLPRYNEVKGDRRKLKMFCSRNRNPIWDLTNIKYFKTGLKSQALMKSDEKGVSEHYIQRSLCMELIFRKLNENPSMTVEQFIKLLRKYSSTVSLTQKEHKAITNFTKDTDVMNYMVYHKLGIKVKGLKKFIDETPKLLVN